MDGRVVIEGVAAQHLEDDVEQRGGRGARLGVGQVRRVLRRGVRSRVLAGVEAVGVGDRRQRLEP
jgi:hypothetical protein